MGWIRSSDGKFLINLNNIIALGIDRYELTTLDEDEKIDIYRIIAETYCGNCGESEHEYCIGDFYTTREAALEELSRIERWLEKGAQGVFQVDCDNNAAREI
ncbi:MAG: hypothetical protein QHH75_11985 [Bacillota bacterium]|nr:hypothetical protein [Bacillota bacterium]